MKSHQFDLNRGESLSVGDYTVTVLEVDIDNGEIVLQIEDPDGCVQIAALATVEPALV